MRDFHLPGRSGTYATGGMCATSHPLAARTAIDILERGGNAMDAAIAGAVLLGICEPQMTGIGGDCFALFTTPGDPTIRALNGSGRAPAAASAAALRAADHDHVPLQSAHAVTVPCAIDAFCRLSADHGRLGLDAVLAPAIRYAEEGVPIAPRVAFDLQTASKALQGHGITHFSRGGAPLGLGETFRAPGQAEVLRRIANDGRAAFYEGEVAEDMLAALHAHGGVHTAQDFAPPPAITPRPVSGDYKTATLVEHPPNGQGATAILLLNILGISTSPRWTRAGAERIHIEAEATKLAYDARNRFIADPGSHARLDHMLAPETAARLAALIDPAAPCPPPRRSPRRCIATRSTSPWLIATAWRCRSSTRSSTASARASHPRNSASCCRIAARASPSKRGTPTRWPGASGPCTRSFRACWPKMTA